MVDFEFIEHTADIRARIYGTTLEALFKNAARCLFSLIVEHDPKPIIEERIDIEAEDIEESLITWLNELISLFFAYKFLPKEYFLEIEQIEGKVMLKSVIKGENFDPYANTLKTEIKAATYHDLKLVKGDSGWSAEVIFDV